eukprot:788243_1
MFIHWYSVHQHYSPHTNDAIIHTANRAANSISRHGEAIQRNKILYGVLLVIGIGTTWASGTQFAQHVETKTAVTIPPFAYMWWATSFQILWIIPVIITQCTSRLVTQKGTTQDITPNSFRMCSFYIFFYGCWVGANYSYYAALEYDSATIVVALFSSNNMIVYILSIFVLSERFNLCRMSAVVISIGGILFIALPNLHQQITISGSILAIISSIFAAIYKVYFKKIFTDMTALNVCKFLVYIALINVLFGWIIILILDKTSSQILPTEPLKEWPWALMIAQGLFAVLFDFLVNFGISYTYPLFIALGIIIGIPFNFIADMLFNHVVISEYEVMGIVCICAGFMIIVITDLYMASGD